MLLVTVLAVGGTLVTSSGIADISDSCQTGMPPCTNVQEGDNDGGSNQEGSASSGDSVGGQVTGVVSSGDATVDATNESTDIDITTGTTDGANDAAHIVGLNDGAAAVSAADVDNLVGAHKVQEGDNNYTLAQAVDASSGDGVGGQVLGTVTSSGGSAGIVAQNTSTDVNINTGTSTANNDTAAFVGLNNGPPVSVTADISNITTGFNVQEGDNDLQGGQVADAASGDGVGGQVLGVVSTRDAQVDATSTTHDVNLETGATASNNDAAYFVGLNIGGGEILATADVDNVTAAMNLQEGDNSKVFAQAADASSGDAVAGQVGGVVTSAGGSADPALDNTSTEVDAQTGATTFNNDDAGFIGLNTGGTLTITG